MVSKYRIAGALRSYGALLAVLEELTEEEVLACLQLEAGSQRRESVLKRLISRAVRLNEIKYAAQLKQKYRS